MRGPCLTVLAAVSMCVACDRSTTPITPTQQPLLVAPAPPIPPTPPTLELRTITRAITLGERVTGTFAPNDTWQIDMTAARTGFAVVRLSWNNDLTWIDLTWDERLMTGDRTRGKVTMTLREAVESGRTYRLRILDAYPWDNYGSTFVLETVVEQ
jgi:hypothetical protein